MMKGLGGCNQLNLLISNLSISSQYMPYAIFYVLLDVGLPRRKLNEVVTVNYIALLESKDYTKQNTLMARTVQLGQVIITVSVKRDEKK